jgi:hypothetical protein
MRVYGIIAEKREIANRNFSREIGEQFLVAVYGRLRENAFHGWKNPGNHIAGTIYLDPELAEAASDMDAIADVLLEEFN